MKARKTYEGMQEKRKHANKIYALIKMKACKN